MLNFGGRCSICPCYYRCVRVCVEARGAGCQVPLRFETESLMELVDLARLEGQWVPESCLLSLPSAGKQVWAAVPGFFHWFLGTLLTRVLVLARLCLHGRSFTHCTISLASFCLVFSAGTELLPLAITPFHTPTVDESTNVSTSSNTLMRHTSPGHGGLYL